MMIKKILIALGILGVASAAGIADTHRISPNELQAEFEKSEIATEYEIENAKMILPAKNINKVKTEIGSDNEFLPQVALSRWNEVSFKVKPEVSGSRSVKFEGNKVRFETFDMDYEMYDYEDGYKFVWYLNSKPESNIVSFPIESEGLNFYYQPPLDEEHPEKNCIPTACFDENNATTTYRPENVVGSYAVFHKSKSGNNTKVEKNYRTGKAFHIYRPRLIDAEGKEAWGKLSIENGVYSVEIPQEFLDKAVYPICSNDTFGYESIGSSGGTHSTDSISGNKQTTGASQAGILDSVSIGASGSVNTKGAVYNSDHSLLDGGTDEVGLGSEDWYTANLTGESISESTEYHLMCFWRGDYDMNFRYDSTPAIDIHDFDVPYNSWPNPKEDQGGYGWAYSIYVTYTPSGNGEAEAPQMKSQIIE